MFPLHVSDLTGSIPYQDIPLSERMYSTPGLANEHSLYGRDPFKKCHPLLAEETRIKTDKQTYSARSPPKK